MGHRANFIIIRDNQAKAFWDQWAALGCLGILHAGPDQAAESVAEFEETTELLDWAFAEGGYLIDFDKKVAIMFGEPMNEVDFDFPDEEDEEVQEENEGEGFAGPENAAIPRFDPPSFLQEIAPKWSGWRLIYDDRGVDAFANYMKARGIAGITPQPPSHPPDTAAPVEIQA